MGIAEIVVSLLGIVASLAPGVLAAITSKGTDAEAIEAARAAVLAIPQRPAGSALDAHLQRITSGVIVSGHVVPADADWIAGPHNTLPPTTSPALAPASIARNLDVALQSTAVRDALRARGWDGPAVDDEDDGA